MSETQKVAIVTAQQAVSAGQYILLPIPAQKFGTSLNFERGRRLFSSGSGRSV
jgi:hypothetical protein